MVPFVNVYMRRNDCNEWKAEKRRDCTNVGKLGTTRIMTVAVRYFGSGSWTYRNVMKIDFCWTKCTFE